MNDDVFNMGVRKFLKVVGVTSQREMERAVQQAIGDGRLTGSETLRATVVLSVDGLDIRHEITGEIPLE